jgi:hypothetical protein
LNIAHKYPQSNTLSSARYGAVNKYNNPTNNNKFNAIPIAAFFLFIDLVKEYMQTTIPDKKINGITPIAIRMSLSIKMKRPIVILVNEVNISRAEMPTVCSDMQMLLNERSFLYNMLKSM